MPKLGKWRRTIIDEATSQRDGYGMSQTRRKMTGCIFGRGNQHSTIRKTKHRSVTRVTGDFLLNLIADNLIRLPKLAVA